MYRYLIVLCYFTKNPILVSGFVMAPTTEMTLNLESTLKTLEFSHTRHVDQALTDIATVLKNQQAMLNKGNANNNGNDGEDKLFRQFKDMNPTKFGGPCS